MVVSRDYHLQINQKTDAIVFLDRDRFGMAQGSLWAFVRPPPYCSHENFQFTNGFQASVQYIKPCLYVVLKWALIEFLL